MANEGLIWTILVLSAIGILMNGYALLTVPVNIDTSKLASDVAKQIVVPAVPSAPTQDISSLEKGITDIKTQLNEDDDWKALAIDLATSEWNRSKYKDIYNFIDDEYGNIVDREDISSVTITDTEVNDLDTEDKDATVIQEIKVKYEDNEGDNKKVYLIVTTEILDNEVDSQDIEVA
jgi:hypothetical protein